LKEGRTILKEKDDMIEQMSKEQRTEIVAVVRECTAILTTVSDFLDRYERHFDQHTIELEKKQREKHE
jgi:gas vesicle protein